MIFQQNIFANFFLKRVNLILFLIMGLALFFRGYNLESKIIWHDEIYSQFHIVGYYYQELNQNIFHGQIIQPQDLQFYLKLRSDRTFVDTIKGLLLDDPHHPPLYYLLAKFWLYIWGDNIISSRILSVISGIVILPIAYLLSQEIFKQKRISLIFTFLIANSPFFVLFAQEAREYSLWALFILLSYLFLLKALNTKSWKGGGVYWGCYTFSLTAGIYTSALMLTVIISQFIYLILIHKWSKRNLFFYSLSLTLSFGMFLPWLLGFIENFHTYKLATAWISQTNLPAFIFIKHLLTNIGRLFLLLNPVEPQVSLLNILLLFIIVLIIIISYYYLVIYGDKTQKIFLLIFSLTPFLLLVIPDILFGGIRAIIPRYLIPTQLGLFLVIAYYLGINYKSKLAKIFFMILIIFGLSANIKNLSTTTAWTKDINYNLNTIAEIINDNSPSLVVGNDFGYHFGTFFALSYLLDENTNLQLFSHKKDLGNVLNATSFKTVYFLNMPDSLKSDLLSSETVILKDIFSDRDLKLTQLKHRNQM